MSSDTIQARTFSEKFTDFFNKWTPNPMVIAYLLTAIVAIMALALTDTPFISFSDPVHRRVRENGIAAQEATEKAVLDQKYNEAYNLYFELNGIDPSFASSAERVWAEAAGNAAKENPDNIAAARAAAEVARLNARREAAGEAGSLVEAWGMGFWTLLELAMQMALILITGSVIAASPPVRKFLMKVASKPNSMGQAVLLVLCIIPVINWFHFGLGIMLGIHLGRQIMVAAKKKGYKIHHPLFVTLLYACGICGIGISQVAPIFGASAGALRTLFPHREADWVIQNIPEVVPLMQTAFLPSNIILCIVALFGVFVSAWILKPKNENDYVAPPDDLIKEIEEQNASIAKMKASIDKSTPAGKIDNSIIPSLIIAVFGLIWIVRFFAIDRRLDFNNFNLLMIIIGALLCLTPNVFMRVVQMSIGQTWGIIIQFPFYAGIFGLLTYTGLNEVIVGFFMRFATVDNWPFITYVYTSIVNIAVPSGGPKFFIVAPYALEVAVEKGVEINRMLLAYVGGDISTNGILPFWALPYLAMFKLDFKKMLPYGLMATIFAYILFAIYYRFIINLGF